MEGAGKEEEFNLGGEESRVAGAQESQVAQRSRWQAVLLEAGGLSAALSEESMRRLKYCLHWLQVRFSPPPFSLHFLIKHLIHPSTFL